MAARALLPENRNPAASCRPGGQSLQVVERSAIVSFAPAQMFAVVNDVARYPEFLPWCVGARVESRSATEMLASVKIARGVLRTEFTTRNTLQQDAQILMRLVDGPFRQLLGQWRFEAIGERYSDLGNTQILPAYSTLSAGVLVERGGATFQVAADNLTNSHGLTEGNPRFVGGTGAALPDNRPIFGRSFKFTVGYKF